MKLHPVVSRFSPALLVLTLASCGSESEPASSGESSTPPPEAAPASSAGAAETVASLEQKTGGLWRYTGLQTSDGKDLPLTGIFLFKDGLFLQQAVFNSEPFAEAGSMAHAGPYRAEPATGSLHLIAEQTISLDPTQASPLTFRAATEHDVTVTREADDLTLIFGMGTGTVQKFSRVGPGEGQLYPLDNGALALVDGHFIVVDGDESGVTSGYGTYRQEDGNLNLEVIRWSQSDGSTVTNLRDKLLEATFDGQTLELADGRVFRVVKEE